MSGEAVRYIGTLTDVRFDLFRTADLRPIEKKKVSVHRYVCPSCGNIVRSTKEVHVGCLDCDRRMVEQDDEIRKLKEMLLKEQ